MREIGQGLLMELMNSFSTVMGQPILTEVHPSGGLMADVPCLEYPWDGY